MPFDKTNDGFDSQKIGFEKPIFIKEAAEFLNLSTSHLYKQTSCRAIPHFKSGKKIYFKKDELLEWVYRNRIRTNDELATQAANYCVNSKPGRVR